MGRTLTLQRKILFAEVSWLLIAAPLGYLMVEVSLLFIIPFLACFVALGLYLITRRCPECGKPVLFNPSRIGGMEFWVWTPSAPDRCSKCGEDLKTEPPARADAEPPPAC